MRVLALAAAAACVLLNAPPALATPSPSPSLDGLLAPAPSSGYIRNSEVYPAVNGTFDAVDYLGLLDPRHPSETLTKLKEAGFVQGYGRAWVDRAAGHYLLEVVIAFSGGAGATNWLPQERSLDEDNDYFTQEFQVSGIDVGFGARFDNPNPAAYFEVIGFVKGNDFFVVNLFSRKNDLGDTASKQARLQYDSAPAGTIPQSQWPENASSHANTTRSTLSVSPPPTALIIAIAAGIVLLAAILIGILLMRRARRSRSAAGPVDTSGGLLLSPDGTHWWDGQAWRDAQRDVPPAAMRSADGSYWWDGQKWRLVQPLPS